MEISTSQVLFNQFLKSVYRNIFLILSLTFDIYLTRQFLEPEEVVQSGSLLTMMATLFFT
jgi:hypothetical protein